MPSLATMPVLSSANSCPARPAIRSVDDSFLFREIKRFIKFSTYIVYWLFFQYHSDLLLMIFLRLAGHFSLVLLLREVRSVYFGIILYFFQFRKESSFVNASYHQTSVHDYQTVGKYVSLLAWHSCTFLCAVRSLSLHSQLSLISPFSLALSFPRLSPSAWHNFSQPFRHYLQSNVRHNSLSEDFSFFAPFHQPFFLISSDIADCLIPTSSSIIFLLLLLKFLISSIRICNGRFQPSRIQAHAWDHWEVQCGTSSYQGINSSVFSQLLSIQTVKKLRNSQNI